MDTVVITRSLTRSSISIHIQRDGSILVKAPFFATRGSIDALIKKHERWIKTRQAAQHERKKSQEDNIYFYLGKKYTLTINPQQKEPVIIAETLSLGSANKKYINTYLMSWYKQQARKIISERVHHYARISGATFRTIKITSAETRWGSCSSQKTLNFNWKLVMAPLPVVDYVVTHELAHLSEMNHSRAFWETVQITVSKKIT